MDMMRQVRKADQAQMTASLADEHRKADYIEYLITVMIYDGTKPWKYYELRTDEEYHA